MVDKSILFVDNIASISKMSHGSLTKKLLYYNTS